MHRLGARAGAAAAAAEDEADSASDEITQPSSEPKYRVFQKILAKDNETPLLYEAVVRKIVWGPKSMKMKLSHFQYDLPEELIAQHPTVNRDESRLMVVNRKEGTFEHKRFDELLDQLPRAVASHTAAVVASAAAVWSGLSGQAAPRARWRQ